VWIEADVYEKDIPFIRAGERIAATVEALPNRVFDGRVALIYPQVDLATRTNRVRFEVNNASGELHPGMFATVRIDTPVEAVSTRDGSSTATPTLGTPNVGAAVALPHSQGGSLAAAPTLVEPSQNTPMARGQILAVPERAVIDTGSRQIVYVERQPGLFEGVEVQLGPGSDGFYPVLKGLEAGQRVAAAGAFLIDAETRLNPAAASTYFGASGGPQTGTGHGALPTTQTDASQNAKSPPAALSASARQNIAKLPPADRAAALTQKICPITGAPLGSMGVPQKVVLKGRTVFLCCPGCIDQAKSDPDGTLKKVEKSKHD
jgi:membrane fusion protein, copper/silver efflux system